MALGAGQGDVSRLVLRRGLLLAVLGVAIGGFGAWALSGLLRSLLNDVQPTDASVFLATAATVAVVALAASYWPARSAGRTDPTVVLRES